MYFALMKNESLSKYDINDELDFGVISALIKIDGVSYTYKMVPLNNTRSSLVGYVDSKMAF